MKYKLNYALLKPKKVFMVSLSKWDEMSGEHIQKADRSLTTETLLFATNKEIFQPFTEEKES